MKRETEHYIKSIETAIRHIPENRIEFIECFVWKFVDKESLAKQVRKEFEEEEK